MSTAFANRQAARSALKGVTKAAALLLTLGPEASSRVLRSLQEHEIEALTARVATLDGLTADEAQAVVSECETEALTQRFVATGGVDYAREMLSLTLGEEQADALVGRVVRAAPSTPFEFLRRTDPKELAAFLQDEHPQTIALILSYLPPTQASAVLTSLAADVQADVAFRIASMERTPPQIVKRVEDVMRRRLSSLVRQDALAVGGARYLVALLTSTDRGTEHHIIERLAETDPDLADEVRKLLFTFDDLGQLDDRSIQRVLRDVDTRDLALALKAARDELRERIFSNMSSRAAETLREDISFLGPVRIRAVEEAQQRIVAVVRRLEEAEEIVVARGQEQFV